MFLEGSLLANSGMKTHSPMDSGAQYRSTRDMAQENGFIGYVC